MDDCLSSTERMIHAQKGPIPSRKPKLTMRDMMAQGIALDAVARQYPDDYQMTTAQKANALRLFANEFGEAK